MKRNLHYLAAGTGLAVLLLLPSLAWAQIAPPLGAADQFGCLGNSGVTGASGGGVLVSGDVGSSPTATIVNFPPSATQPPWSVHFANDGVVQQARADSDAAYGNLFGQGPGTVLPAQLDGATLTSGVYSFQGGAADLASNGTLTLNGGGVFVFEVDSALTANVGSSVVGSADPCSVFWRVGTSATLNGAEFWGTVIADATITLGAGANLTGRALAGSGPTGAVTMAGNGGNTIQGCSSTPTGCPVIVVSPATLPPGGVGVAYSQQLTATGGTGPYTFAVTSGTLPPGLTLSAGGLLSGTPTAAGSSPVTIQATDANGCPGDTSYTIVVSVVTPTLPQAFLVLLALGLLGVGFSRLRRRARES